MLSKEDLLKPETFEIKWLKENGFKRKICTKCKAPFWTQVDRDTCGEPPCDVYGIIGKPIISKKYDWKTMRTKFLEWFEENGHTPIQRYSTVCRWKPDTLFVGASIYDFMPWVLNKTIEPPANPLAVAQPCIRFGDLDNVGLGSGRHCTQFHMFGHHAFNYPKKPVYWKDRTIELCWNWMRELGIKPDQITFKESLWKGGGYAGPCFEVLTGGIETATLVFMEYEGPVNNGFKKMDMQVVDTGYGLERHVWASTGTPTVYDSIYPDLISWMRKKAGVEKYDEKVFSNFCRVCGELDVGNVNVDIARKKIVDEIAKKLKLSSDEIFKLIMPYHYIYQIADHSRALAFIIGDGVVPSNTEEGYLARLLIRRSIRNINDLKLDIPLTEVVSKQIDDLKSVYPEFHENRDDIIKLISSEEDKYRDTIKKGESTVGKVVSELKKRGKKEVDRDTLIMLYDSHGLLPRDVQKYSELKLADISDIDTKIAVQKEAVKKEEVKAFDITGVPETQLLFREDEHLFEFDAKVLKIVNDKAGFFVMLDKTAFYPRGGGQEPDHGEINGCRMYDAEKFGNVVMHFVEKPNFKEGAKVKCKVDKERRKRIMLHHTATHILAGAARKVLGPHIWQRGSKKDEDKAHIDMTHHMPVTEEEMEKIEKLSNDIIKKNINIIKTFLDRTTAEREYGFTIYQGGAVPGKILRICSITNHDTEACGGIHADNTGEVGLITIIKVERPTDGTVRFIYKAGDVAKEFLESRSKLLKESAKLLGVEDKDAPKAAAKLLEDWKDKRKELEKKQEELAKKKLKSLRFEEAKGFKILIEHLPNTDMNQMKEISRAMTADNTVIL